MDDGQRARVVSDLVERHYELLYRFAYRLSGSAADAEDLTQHAFLTAQTKLEQLREPDKERAWLLTIVRNAYLKNLRDDARLVFSDMENTPEPHINGDTSLALDAETVQETLNELPEEFRTPLILFYLQEMSYKQIAEMLDVPIGTVMSRLSRGKAHLRKRLSPVEPEAACVERAARV
jgi:RNA polymerase sigma-70 factor (ECF subfamily)